MSQPLTVGLFPAQMPDMKVSEPPGAASPSTFWIQMDAISNYKLVPMSPAQMETHKENKNIACFELFHVGMQ